MDKTLMTTHSVLIQADASDVWKTITQPSKIKEFLYGTHVETDWKVGSAISLSGEYEGHTYRDKGLVMAVTENVLLAYDYWSQFSGLPDVPENYSEVALHIKDLKDGNLVFTWEQIGFKNETSRDHTKAGLPGLLAKIKELSEKDDQI